MNGYSGQLSTVGLGTRLRRTLVPPLHWQDIQANRNRLTFCITDKLAEMWDTRDRRGIANDTHV